MLSLTECHSTQQQNCGSCHTNYPHLMARPLPREFPSPRSGRGSRFFENRVAHWDDPKKEAKPRWDAEDLVRVFFVYRRTVLSRLEFCDSKDPKHIGYEPLLRIESAYSGFPSQRR